MTKEAFTDYLKTAQLKKKDFSTLVSMSYGSVANWGQPDKPIPDWVKSYLELYIENQKYKKLKEAIKESGACG